MLKEFCTSFSFAGTQFDTALRTFLLAFRLPGEAQCIDRLMEAFSAELFKQWRDHEAATRASAADAASDDASAPGGGGDGDRGGGGGGGSADGEDRSEWAGPFANADAVFVLSFSTIMLQTDLHNVGIPPEKKMKVEQFVNNNRGINKGANLPRDFLEALYASIAARPSRWTSTSRTCRAAALPRFSRPHDPEPEDDDLSTGADGGVHGIASNDSSGDLGKSPGKDTEKRRSAWDGLLEKRRLAVASASFTERRRAQARVHVLPTGAHERDMFSSIADACISAVATAFVQTRDDVLVLKALRGFHQYARRASTSSSIARSISSSSRSSSSAASTSTPSRAKRTAWAPRARRTTTTRARDGAAQGRAARLGGVVRRHRRAHARVVRQRHRLRRRRD